MFWGHELERGSNVYEVFLRTYNNMTLRKSSRQKVAPLKSSEAVVNYGGRFGSFVQ